MKQINEISKALKEDVNIEEALKDTMQVCSNHYLGYFLSNLVLEFLTYFEYVLEDGNKHIIKEDSQLSGVIDYIKSSLLDPAAWLSLNKNDLGERIDRLTSYRDALSNNVAAIAGYDDQLKMHDYVLRRRALDYGSHPSGKISDDEMASNLLKFLFEFEDAVTINDRIKTVYAQLPVRMSKLKLKEWIEMALLGMKGVTVGDLDNYITYLKETYNPSGIACYGEVLSSVFEQLNTFDVLYTDIVGSEVVEPLEDAMNHIKITLESCVSLYTYTASVINNMIGLLIVLNEESIEENDDHVQRFIRVMNHIDLRKDEEMLIDEDIVAELDDIAAVFESIRMDNGKYDGLIEEAKQGHINQIVELGLDKSYDRLASLYVLQSASYFAPLSQSVDASQLVDEKVLIEKKNDLIAYLEEVSKDDTRIGKRARIANLLGVMNVIHKNPQEIHRYMLNTLTQCKDEREKTGSKIVLNEMMQ